MCGIAGFIDTSIRSEVGSRVLDAMIASIAHRGPDAAGRFVDTDAGVWLGHRRLAVRDTSTAGAQPMQCACGRVVVTYNGEIYNAEEIARGLPAFRRRGSSDTEVLVEAICSVGVERTLDRLDGMYAFAAWDRQERKLHLARDPFGIKPLVYGSHAGVFMFGSETRTLYPHPSFIDDIDAGAVEQYLRYHYIPAPLSIYRHVTKLAPGSYITVDVRSGSVSLGPQRTFWSLAPVLEAPARDITDDAAIARLAGLVEDAVRKQMVSDVPVGAFLSSGVDSTLIVALQQALSDEPVRTYTISAGAQETDEGPDASHTARLLGTKHTERRITDDDVIERVAHASVLFDEPFAEPSQLAISLLAEEARADVTVVLTGDGGDEVSAGYSWYEQFGRGWSIHQRMGRPLRAMTARGCDLAARVGAAEPLSPNVRERLLADAPRVAAMLRSTSAPEFYASLRSEFPESVAAVRGLRQAPDSVVTGASVPTFEGVQDLALFLDTRSFLPQHPLTKVDRTSMAVGLEARPPLLDRDVMEFAASLPAHMRFRPGQPKWLLQSVARLLLPPELLNRPKRGFVMPLETWIRGPLDQWMRSRVEPAATRHDILEPDVVRRVLDQHDAGVDRSRVLWSIAMLEDWLRHEAEVRRRAAQALVET